MIRLFWHARATRAERDRLQQVCVQIAAVFQFDTPLNDLDRLVDQVSWLKAEHDQLERSLDATDDQISRLEVEQVTLHERLQALVDEWETEARILLAEAHHDPRDADYAQACRDHAAALASALLPT